ncbi:flagellar biosynthesis protein FliQ [Melaminivora jejuensis]|uniref:flagellar biosynthesis protein FliQ n=1 Tax=Melaminivora jejuensis TaxID=1267217 RepID=UPI001ADF6467|nr:flagellar biosynthesis protein FliQ [Melaminivora jejuensis]UHJ64605.1 flagellar biosynthesis protein FliQ [Melaminivora jejuensis]
MTPQFVLTMGREALTTLLMIALPVLGTVMAVGLTVSIFQAVTQIHEATLAFVPKLLGAVLVLAIAGPWMLSTLVDFLRRTIEGIPGVVG